MATKTFGQVPTVNKINNDQFLLLTDSSGAVNKIASANVTTGSSGLSGEAILPMDVYSDSENFMLPDTVSSPDNSFAFKIKLPKSFYLEGDNIPGLGTVVADGLVFFRKTRRNRQGDNVKGTKDEHCTKYAEYGRNSKDKTFNILKFQTLTREVDGYYRIPLFKHLESLVSMDCESLFDRNINGKVIFKEKRLQTSLFYSQYVYAAVCRKLVYTDSNGYTTYTMGKMHFGRLFIQEGGKMNNVNPINKETYMNFVMR